MPPTPPDRATGRPPPEPIAEPPFESQIEDVRRGLSLTADDEALVREAAPRLQPEVERLIDAFYARLVTDGVAMALLRDEATVIRLKRSLSAWLHEMLTLPYDAAYERARADIGRTHLRIGMPQHLMVTSMGTLRRDVRDTVERLWADDAPRGRAVLRALEKALDLELALMLSAYRRRERELEALAERITSARELQAHYAAAAADAVDAAMCYAALVSRTDDPSTRRRWSDRLAVAMRAVASLSTRLEGSAGAAREVRPSGPGEAPAAAGRVEGRDADRAAAR